MVQVQRIRLVGLIMICCWFDYDLVSAYTKAKAHLSPPSFSKGHLINPDDLDD